MISNVDDEKVKLNIIKVEERCLLLVNTLGGVQECLMFTEDEKLNLQLVGAGQRNKYVWRILL